jgi:hypothetical protein
MEDLEAKMVQIMRTPKEVELILVLASKSVKCIPRREHTSP